MLDGKGNTANSLIAGSTALQSLMAYLHNEGMNVTVESATLGAGTAANAQVTGADQAVIQVDPSQLATAEDSFGQNADQVLYHELDHIYYESSPNFFQNMPKKATFTIGGATYNYNTANVAGDGGLTNSPGEMAWEHMMIHDDLVDNFGSDDTGALKQGLTGATNPPSSGNLASTISADKSAKGTSSLSISGPPKIATCSSTTSAKAHRLAVTPTGYFDSGLTEQY